MSTNRISPPPPKLVLLDVTNSQLIDTGLPAEIVFQFAPAEVTEAVASAWSSSTGMNRSNPILQYSNGEQGGFQFEAQLWANNNEQSIDELIKALKDATRANDELKRPPRWQFIWGSFIDETVVVQSIGGVRYNAVRNDGTLRGAVCSINLLVYTSVDVALVAEDRPTDTFYAVTKQGETWEDIALRQYDDPLMGELLRRRNPAMPFPGQDPGKVVLLPKPENLRNEPIEPDSPPLRRTAEGLALRQKVYEARSKSRESTIILKA